MANKPKRNITQTERDSQQLQRYRERERRRILEEQLKKMRKNNKITPDQIA